MYLSCSTLELEKSLIHEGAINRSLLSKEDEELFIKRFRMRCDFILGKSSVHFAANILDPHRCGRDLTPEQVVAGCELGGVEQRKLCCRNGTAANSTRRLLSQLPLG